MNSRNSIRGGLHEKSTEQNLMEGMFHNAGRTYRDEVPAEIHIKENYL